MKRCVMVWLAVSAFWATGCIRSFQVSTQPFFHDTEAPGDVTGRWLAEGDEAGGLAVLALGFVLDRLDKCKTSNAEA